MTEAHISQYSPMRLAHDYASTATGGRGGRGRRLGARLWTLLHAPALLAGGVGGPGDVALIEDDRTRLAGRQAR